MWDILAESKSVLNVVARVDAGLKARKPTWTSERMVRRTRTTVTQQTSCKGEHVNLNLPTCREDWRKMYTSSTSWDEQNATSTMCAPRAMHTNPHAPA